MDANILAVNRVYFPNYCLIIKTLKSLNLGVLDFINLLQSKENESLYNCHQMLVFSKELCQNMAFKAKNWLALSNEQYFPKH